MTIDEFVTKLKVKWEDMDTEDLKFIGDELESYNPEQYEHIYVEFRRTYQYKTAPGVANIVKAIESLGLKRNYSRQDLSEYCYKCVKCGQLFAGRLKWNSVYCCPKCFSREMAVAYNQDRKEIATYQEMCVCGWGDYQEVNREKEKGESRCEVWEKQRGAYGPVCDIYGDMRGSNQECKTCNCLTCCNNYKKELEKQDKEWKSKS